MNLLQKLLLCLLAISIGGFLGIAALTFFRSSSQFRSPLAVFGPTPTPTPLPYLSYSFPVLREKYKPKASEISLQDILTQAEKYTAYQFTYSTQGKRMTGQMNVPRTATSSAKFPVILMIRGYVPPEAYQTGIGTKNAAAQLAANGYVTVAPDFLGFGGSDVPDSDSLGARLEKPQQVLDLIESLKYLTFIDYSRLGIWAHSNGGHIALSLLEITGQAYPTTLWAPVSKSFPYSILYYTDESEDQGKTLRKAVADFETVYDVFDFSIDRYWHWITAPIQVHQGSADDAIPVEWSDELVKNLKSEGLTVLYFTYPATDHQLQPVWNTVMNHDLDFFAKYLVTSQAETVRR